MEPRNLVLVGLLIRTTSDGHVPVRHTISLSTVDYISFFITILLHNLLRQHSKMLLEQNMVRLSICSISIATHRAQQCTLKHVANMGISFHLLKSSTEHQYCSTCPDNEGVEGHDAS